MSEKSCPKCGSPTTELVPLQTGLKVALQATGQAAAIGGDSVCPSCYDGLTGLVSQGVKLRVEEEAKQKNKVMLWKNRINLVKQGRQHMQTKSFPEAAISYEKYLKVLELIYEVKPGQLNPDIFSKSNRSKELTVVTTVYWDLVKIYDSSPRYKTRLTSAVSQLMSFAKYSSIFPNIIRKAESFSRKAKNPAELKRFLKNSKSGKSCFIATAVFEDIDAPELIKLRAFRDNYLSEFFLGRLFIKAYYEVSPSIAIVLKGLPRTKRVLKYIFKIFLYK